MSRSEKLTRAIRSLSNATPDIEAAAVIDHDGLMMASSLPQDVEDESVAAMSAALLGLSERINGELSRGDFEMVMIRGKEGFVVLAESGPEAVLTVLTSKRAKLGLVFLDVKRSAREIAGILG